LSLEIHFEAEYLGGARSQYIKKINL